MKSEKEAREDSKLRQRAERKFDMEAGNTEAFSEMPPEEMANLIHELQVHQIELKMQNDELRHTQVALEKARARYSHLYDFAPVGYFTLNEKGIIKEANLTISTMLGIEREALIEQPFTRFVLSDDQDIFHKHRQRFLEKKTNQPCELRFMKKDGRVFYARLEFIFVTDKGEDAKQVSGVISDITDRKRAETERMRMEEKFLQSQKLEALGTLAGGIAHDFNNLLMSIQSRTSLMLVDKDSSHPDFEHLSEIESHVESASELTQQLLAFARGGKYEVKPIDLNELIKKHNRLFGRTKKEITIRGKYESDIWPVDVDPGQIEQVLLNLYVNAWHAMPEGGKLYLTTENVVLDENHVKSFSTQPGKYVKISVTDTGIGMDGETRKRIFDPFFTTKEIGRGTGLGLASAYGIIQNHGGFIQVHSEKGHGSTFIFYLPASEKEIVSERKPAVQKLTGSETILFVDDEEMIAEVVEDLLGFLGYKVLMAGNGREAIRIYEENKDRIDVVVLDMIMPDMGGAETYDRLKEIDPDVKVLLSSGYSTDGQATRILDRGCNGFIQKPFKMNELSQKLREILGEK